MLRVVYIFYIVFGVLKMLAQHNISRYEVYWGILHPFTSFRIKQQLPEAMSIYKLVKTSKYLDTLENGGKLDAFRHVYVMAYLSRKIPSKKLIKLGISHEKGNKLQFTKKAKEQGELPDSVACEMDLRNNTIGITIGKTNRNTTDDELKQIVIEKIKEGAAWYVMRDKNYNYITCNKVVIDLNNFEGKWNIPKCLINTNE